MLLNRGTKEGRKTKTVMLVFYGDWVKDKENVRRSIRRDERGGEATVMAAMVMAMAAAKHHLLSTRL